MSQQKAKKTLINWDLVSVNPNDKNWDWKDLFCFWGVNIQSVIGFSLIASLIVIGLFGVLFGYWLGLMLVVFGLLSILKLKRLLSDKTANQLTIASVVLAIVVLLAIYWRPLGVNHSFFTNLIIVALISFGLLGLFTLFQKYYTSILRWTLNHKLAFLSIPTIIVILGAIIMRNSGKEFMPSLNEGSFLLMPTSLPHAGIEENKRVLQQLDMAVASIPEIETVVNPGD